MQIATFPQQIVKPFYLCLIALAVYWTYGAYSRYHLRSYGVAYNLTRQQLGLPLVGTDWQEVLSDDEITFVNPTRASTGHNRKRVVLGNSGVVKEADLFFLPADRGSLDLLFTGNINTSTATLYRPSQTITMPYAQALDTLKKYSLMR